MSFVRKENLNGHKLVCDGGRCIRPAEFRPRSAVDSENEVRALARRQGWESPRRHVDLCPLCTGRAPGKGE